MIKQIFVVTLLTLFTMPVQASQEDMQSNSRFKNLDKDNNGYISQYEARDKHRVFYYYPKADKNSDGHLDESEFSAFEIEIPDFGSQ